MTDLIVGLNGLKESGKDTAGAYLAEHYGFARLSFAAKLKESAAAALGIKDPAVFEEWKNNPDALITLTINGVMELCITVREYLQLYGTEAHRDIFGEDFWRSALWNSILESEDDRNFVITDARFPDELADVMRKDGLNVRILRPAVENAGDTHASEAVADADLIDFFVRNDGTLENLYDQLDVIMRGLGVEPLTSSTENASPVRTDIPFEQGDDITR